MQGVKDQIDAVYRKLRTGQYETPQSLKDDFSEIRQSLSDYKEGEAMLGHLKEMRADSGLSGKKEQYWIKELSLLEQQLGNRPSDSHVWLPLPKLRIHLYHPFHELSTSLSSINTPDSF